jgi:iron complex transport system ATP-binding protein
MSLIASHLVLIKQGRALLDIPHLHLPSGRLHAVLGPSGSGKSTLLAALAGLEGTTVKQVHLLGRPLHQWDTVALARQRALLTTEQDTPFDFTVKDVVRTGRYPHVDAPHPHEEERVIVSLQQVGAGHLLTRRYSQLSGGEKALVQLARVLAQITGQPQDISPRWLLLDEPIAALDMAGQQQVMGLLKGLTRQGTGVVMVMQDINLASAWADQVLVMKQGRIESAGSGEQILQPSFVARTWGVVCERLAGGDASGCHKSWLALS